MTYEILDGAGHDVHLTEGRTYRFDHVGVEADAGGDVGKIVLHSGAEIKEYSREG